MRFLNRLLKTPDEDRDEDQDEFNAEESGLLIAGPPSGAGEEAAPADPHEAGAPHGTLFPEEGEAPSPLQVEAEHSGDEAGERPEGRGDPPGPAADPLTAVSQEQQSAPEAPQAKEGSSDDPLALFRAAAAGETYVPALKEGLEEVSAVDLLAEARSIRSSLLGTRATGDARQRGEEAA